MLNCLLIHQNEGVIEIFSGNQEKSRLLNEIERFDDTSLITGVSINSGLSSQQTHTTVRVKAELCRRRPSIESGFYISCRFFQNFLFFIFSFS